MDDERIKEALKNLEDRGLIERCDGYYYFTANGRAFTHNKSNNEWCTITITSSNGNALWIRSDPVVAPGDWIFQLFRYITDEQFDDFCNYFEITQEKYDTFNDMLDI